MNTENMIEITGADLVEVAKAAYALSKPMGLGFAHYREGELSDDDAKALINEGGNKSLALRMDYVHGRACKFRVYRDGKRLFIPDRWYDHTDGHLERLLERIGETI